MSNGLPSPALTPDSYVCLSVSGRRRLNKAQRAGVDAEERDLVR